MAHLGPKSGAAVSVGGLVSWSALLTWVGTFGYAESYDEASARYHGMQYGQRITISSDRTGLLVKLDIAGKQLDVEVHPPKDPPDHQQVTLPTGAVVPPAKIQPARLRRSHGFQRAPYRNPIARGPLAETPLPQHPS
jgi:hypothetical protein